MPSGTSLSGIRLLENMRNRAKCKLCQVIIESLAKNDIVTCKCGEISIQGGNEYYGAIAKDFANFLRVTDDGNEIVVQYIESKPKSISSQSEASQESFPEPIERPTREQLLEMLEETLKGIERLPHHALYGPASHADFYSLGALVLSIFKSDLGK